VALLYSVLASGSAGNASFLQHGAFGALIDFGLGPRQLAARLAGIGSSLKDVHAVFLSHVHGDHWRERTVVQLVQRKIPLYCHSLHVAFMAGFSPAFRKLESAGLVRSYQPNEPVSVASGLSVSAFEVSHDAIPTFAFRFDHHDSSAGKSASVGIVTDLGCWTPELASRFRNVNVLALEFNHDVAMEKRSSRSPELIDRVLSDEGHLSNVQAALFLATVLDQSKPGTLRHVVQLHLSRECNLPALAREAAHRVCIGQPSMPAIHTACQDRPGPISLAVPRLPA
jgi:phosphoribosyl 1,2-cyclic phosphodiesterase